MSASASPPTANNMDSSRNTPGKANASTQTNASALGTTSDVDIDEFLSAKTDSIKQEANLDSLGVTAPEPRKKLRLVLVDSSEPMFTLFPKLPAELRVKIWKEHLPDRVFVEVHPRTKFYYTKALPGQAFLPIIRSCPLLRVCKESRAEARKLYRIQEICATKKRGVFCSFDYVVLVFRLHTFSWRLSLAAWLHCHRVDTVSAIKHLLIEEDSYNLIPKIGQRALKLSFAANPSTAFIRLTGLETLDFARVSELVGEEVVAFIEGKSEKQKARQVQLVADIASIMPGAEAVRNGTPQKVQLPFRVRYGEVLLRQ